jgi:PAS domain S-box-containing protein
VADFQALVNNIADMALLNALIKGCNDAVFIAESSTGTIRYVNEAACDMTGYTFDELSGMHQSQLHPKEDLEHITQKFREFVGDSSYIETLANVLHKDGSTIPVKISSADYYEEDGIQYVLAFFKDLTHLERLDRIAFIQSHIVRAPIANILGLVEMLEEDYLMGEAERKQALSDIKQMAQDFDNIIRDIVNHTYVKVA